MPNEIDNEAIYLSIYYDGATKTLHIKFGNVAPDESITIIAMLKTLMDIDK